MQQILFTDLQVAELLAVSRPTIWRLVREGRLAPPLRPKGRLARWHIEDIQKYVSEVRSDA